MKLRSFFFMLIGLMFFVSTGIRGATPDLKESTKTEKIKEDKSVSVAKVFGISVGNFTLQNYNYHQTEFLLVIVEKKETAHINIPTKGIKEFAKSKKPKNRYPRDGLRR